MCLGSRKTNNPASKVGHGMPCPYPPMFALAFKLERVLCHASLINRVDDGFGQIFDRPVEEKLSLFEADNPVRVFSCELKRMKAHQRCNSVLAANPPQNV